MSGHSHWAGIKHKKALTDAKKSSVFTKYGKLISVAAGSGGGDPSTNLRLKFAIEQAQSVNMPKSTIERAVKRGTGELKDGAVIEELTYEALGPGGVAMIIKTATDNRNRTASDVKTILKKNGGQVGSTAYLFKESGILSIPLEKVTDRDALELAAIEAGAEDIAEEDGYLTIYTDPKDLKTVEASIVATKVATTIEAATIGYRPLQKMTIDPKSREQYDALLELLDEHEDVQEVFDNL